MTTFEAAAAGLLRRGSDRIAARAGRRAQRATRVKTAATVAATVRRGFLQTAGLAAFTVAAWTVAVPLGLAVAGGCAFCLAWLLDG